MKSAFSLMEMMVVLLIVAIIAAASAPMVSKKLARDAEANDSPWVYTGTGLNAAYNMSGNRNGTAIIGASSIPNESTANPIFRAAALFIQTPLQSSANLRTPHIKFYRNGSSRFVNMYADTNDRAVMITDNATSGSYAYKDVVAIGTDQQINHGSDTQRIIAIGNGVRNTQINTVAIGNGLGTNYETKAAATGGIAIGNGAITSGNYGIAIGTSLATDNLTTAGVYSSHTGAIAIGSGAKAKAQNAIAIGNGAETSTNAGDININNILKKEKTTITIGTGTEKIVLNGSSVDLNGFSILKTPRSTGNLYTLATVDDTIRLPGKLEVVGDTTLCADSAVSTIKHKVYMGMYETNDGPYYWGEVQRNSDEFLWLYSSDRRLKNVGDKFKGGLDELKKIDLFHYTYKKDESKTPQVGVMAQDLQKVFPNAVTKGSDGYLRIRRDDMFYALINAVKELDNKILELAERVQHNTDSIIEMKKTINQQQKTIDELKSQNAEFEKRLEKIEKALKK